MTEISPGYDPKMGDPDNPGNRSGWDVDDFLSRLEDGSMEEQDLTDGEMRRVFPKRYL
jgi:hypothetical protein